MGEKEEEKVKGKRKRPTQRSGVGLKALRRGLGVGGRKRKKKKKVEGQDQRIYIRRSIRQKLQRSLIGRYGCGIYCNHSRPKADSSIGIVIKGQLAG